MECANQKLLNIIIFIGLVVTISTTIILPTLDWEGDALAKTKKESLNHHTTVAKRP